MKIEMLQPRQLHKETSAMAGAREELNMGRLVPCERHKHGGYVIRQTSNILRNHVLLKALVVSACMATTSIYAVANPEKNPVPTAPSTKKSEDLLLKRAISHIRRTIKRSTGTPYFITCQYKIKDNKAVSATTEVHYADYRKESDESSVEFAPTNGKLDRVVKFVYKPKTNTLAVVDLDAQSRHLATRKVSLAL